MIRRCYEPREPAFRLYGARGIKVCERWLNSLEDFAADMGPKPSSKHSIDRINNDGDYEPTNCSWATQAEQMRNTSRTHKVTAFGKTLSLADWERETGVNAMTISQRLERGWEPELSVSLLPINGNRFTKRAAEWDRLGRIYTNEQACEEVARRAEARREAAYLSKPHEAVE